MTTQDIRYAIADANSGDFFRNRKGPDGWYTPNIGEARIYKASKQAYSTVRRMGHHVAHPDRKPVVCKVKLEYMGLL